MNSKVFKSLKSQNGDGLAELMVAIGIGSIVALAMSVIFTFGIQQFGLLVQENKAEESLLQSAYLMKAYLSQAVKITCAPGIMPLPTTLALDGAAPCCVPTGIPIGQIDCRAVEASPTEIDTTGLDPTHWTAWRAGQRNPFALFFRETGGAASTGGAFASTYSANSATGSTYLGTGIYFTPAANQGTGVLTFAQQTTGTDIDTSIAVQWDHIVDVGIVAGSTVCLPGPLGNSANCVVGAPTDPAAEPNNLESLTVRIVARYYTNFQSNGANYNYFPMGAANPTNLGWKDIDIEVPISFRDTYLGISNTGTYTPERLYGGIYFFRFTAPPLTSFDF